MMADLIIVLAILFVGYGAFALYFRHECRKAKRKGAKMVDDLISRAAALNEIAQITDDRKMNGVTVAVAIQKLPAVNAVPRDVLEQIRWERDIAIEQLKSYGVSFGEKADCAKVVRCKDCEKRDKSADLTFDVFCRWFEAVMDKNDFCSYGERREDDG